MNPPVEEWIACSEKAVERALKEMEDLIEYFDGKPVIMRATHGYKQECLKSAVNNLEEELRWRQVSIKEKYCE